MRRKKFKTFLERRNIPFIEKETEVKKFRFFPYPKMVKKTVLTIGGASLSLYSIDSMPEDVEFNNSKDLDFNDIKYIPKGVVFNNGGRVHLYSVISIAEGTIFNNGTDVILPQIEDLPKGVIFNNGGKVHLKHGLRIEIGTSYIKRWNAERNGDNVYLYKRVSHDFKTQEDTPNETLWQPGTVVEHPKWNPTIEECGAGKFHACAFPHWCDTFRKGYYDRYIKIEVDVKDLHEWLIKPGHLLKACANIFEWVGTQRYPQKISFRKCKVVEEVDSPF